MDDVLRVVQDLMRVAQGQPRGAIDTDRRNPVGWRRARAQGMVASKAA
jgi:hypothetical protein